MKRYFALRIVRLSAAPEPLARAIACGVAVSFFPVFGIHALMGVALAFMIRANLVAAGLSTLLLPPVILPLVFSLDFIVGRHILQYFGYDTHGSEDGFSGAAAAGASYIHSDFTNLFLPALVGSALFMALAWPAAYMASHKLIGVLVHRHHENRRQKREKAAS